MSIVDSAATVKPLFQPFAIGGLELSNRIVMAPMTRNMSPGGVPGPDVAAYYRRRAEGGVGLIFTEGTFVPYPGGNSFDPNVPRFYGDDALAGWRRVVDEVHAAGGKIVPQLWNVGLMGKAGTVAFEDILVGIQDQMGPSGMTGSLGVDPVLGAEPATQQQIDTMSEAFVEAARSAHHLGFDGVALHGAHGYLFDQFFWHKANLRTDRYGGDMAKRTRFAADIIREIRSQTSPDFPIILRISQWKAHNYGAKTVDTPEELAAFLEPLADAGVDIFDCSQRRFWQGEFGTDLGLAGWVKKLSGKPVITVGSVTLKQEMLESLFDPGSEIDYNVPRLVELFERGDFDLVAIGRALIADPDWPLKIRAGELDQIRAFDTASLKELK